jgi:lipopolysaccharide export system protein LptA
MGFRRWTILMMMWKRHAVWTALMLTLGAGWASAQQPGRESERADRVNIDWSEVFEVFQRKDGIERRLSGSPARSVELSQDSIFMYCDSAIISDRDTRVVARGNVVIQQGDSISVFADSLRYSGVTRVANLYGNVILQSRDRKLFTDSLRYDLRAKLATYTSGGTLINRETQLSSQRGYYYVGRDEAFFRENVVAIDPQFVLKADTLKFNTATNVTTFLGPTLISSDTSRIYCEAGYYDTENNQAEFTKNAQYVRGEQRARARIIRFDGSRATYSLIGDARFEEGPRRAYADTIRYDERNDITYLQGKARFLDERREIEAPQIVYDAKKDNYSTKGRARISDPPQILEADEVDFREDTGLGMAAGNVIWRDTSAELTIFCAYADYDRQTDYLKASGGARGRPLLVNILDGDSLFMSADTLLAFREDSLSADTSRILLAYNDVRIFKSDMQARCDSLAFRDSVFRFFRDPIIWSDTSQFIADTIHMHLVDKKIDKIYLVNKGLIINSQDEVFFNQIKGKLITAHFADSRLYRMDVEGNAESIYYALDEEGAYIGVNKTICSEMIIYWDGSQVERIRFLTQPSGVANPMGKVNHEELRVEGFRWVKAGRPRSVDDLFDDGAPLPPSEEEDKKDAVEESELESVLLRRSTNREKQE